MQDTVKVKAFGDAAVDRGHLGQAVDVVSVGRIHKELHPWTAGESLVELLKIGKEGASSQGLLLGVQEHPFNFDVMLRMQIANPHHARCIHAKVGATVGLGFESIADRARKLAKRQGQPEPTASPESKIPRIDTVLDKLCRHSWQDLLHDVAEDYYQTGNGYIEVVREESNDTSPILGLFHIPSKEIKPVVENSRYDFHWQLESTDDTAGNRLFARFGDMERFLEANKDSGTRALPGSLGMVSTERSEDEDGEDKEVLLVSEVIHIRRPTSLSRWYGFPDWIAATPAIELAQCLTQHHYDFYLNRGVPEFILLLFGQRLDPATKAELTSTLQKATGLGNSHKSVIVSLPQGTTAQMEKLALEHAGDGSMFGHMSDNLGLQIVSAHGVPAMLAGIQIPGKMGAANELVQALIAFQLLVISPSQRLFERTLHRTLGSDKTLGLEVGDFVLNKLLDEIDLQSLDTLSRMRQDPTEAEGQGRTTDQGLRD